MSDFWNNLTQGRVASEAPTQVDRYLSPKDFEGVRTLTDKYREANALPLPVAAGTKVSFTGSLGAVLSMKNPPEAGAVGTVVSVKSAGHEITAHEGRVFVKFDDGELRTIHAEFLRRASGKREASSRARPHLERLHEVLRPMGCAGVTPQGDGLLFYEFGRSERQAIQEEISRMSLPLRIVGRAKPVYGDLTSTEGPRPPEHYMFVPMEVVRIRAASLGDLTEFLKVAEGKLVHKSTQDLWSIKKDADGNLMVERLFDDQGEPLKG